MRDAKSRYWKINKTGLNMRKIVGITILWIIISGIFIGFLNFANTAKASGLASTPWPMVSKRFISKEVSNINISHVDTKRYKKSIFTNQIRGE